ncbi:hypothetical protein PROFUN_05764 [Planoprotostelium fungivorum]|uniref:Uncharacterized protein n=1 Tax=Planoprotostelium fungivorum TaxID=1890364 RepID=A0A2P6NPW7_9EUKA|nr:hypothetical protein PROFUN_05764 [Planoprotostelium fungivorum]
MDSTLNSTMNLGSTMRLGKTVVQKNHETEIVKLRTEVKTLKDQLKTETQRKAFLEKTIDTQVKELEKANARNLSLETRVRDASWEKNTATQNRAAAERQMVQLANRLTIMQKEFDAMKGKKDPNLTALEKKLSVITRDLDITRSAFRSAKEEEEMKIAIEKQSKEELRASLVAKDEKLRQFQESLRELRQEIAEKEDSHMEETQKLQDQIRSVKTEKEALSTAMDANREECSSINQQLSQMQGLNQNLNQQITQLSSERDKITKEKKELNDTIRERELELQNAQDLNRELEKKLSDTEKEISRVEGQLEEVKSQRSSLNEKITEKERELRSREEELRQMRSASEGLQSLIQSTSDATRQQEVQLNQEIHHLELESNELKDQVSQLTVQLEQRENEKSQLESIEREQKREIQNMKDEIQRQMIQIENINRQLEQQERVSEEQCREIKRVTHLRAEGEAMCAEMRVTITELESRVLVQEEKYQKLEGAYKSTRGELEEREEEIRGERKRYEQIALTVSQEGKKNEEMKEENERQLVELQRISHRLDSTSTELASSHQTVAALTSQLQDVQAESQQRSTLISTREEELEHLHSRLQRLTQMNEETMEERTVLKDKLSSEEKERRRAESAVEALEREISDRKEEIEGYQAQTRSLSDQQRELNESITSMNLHTQQLKEEIASIRMAMAEAEDSHGEEVQRLKREIQEKLAAMDNATAENERSREENLQLRRLLDAEKAEKTEISEKIRGEVLIMKNECSQVAAQLERALDVVKEKDLCHSRVSAQHKEVVENMEEKMRRMEVEIQDMHHQMDLLRAEAEEHNNRQVERIQDEENKKESLKIELKRVKEEHDGEVDEKNDQICQLERSIQRMNEESEVVKRNMQSVQSRVSLISQEKSEEKQLSETIEGMKEATEREERYKRELEDITLQLDEEKRELEKAREELHATKTNMSSLEKELGARSEEMEDIKRVTAEGQKRLQESNEKISQLQESRSALEVDLQQSRDQIEREVKKVTYLEDKMRMKEAEIEETERKSRKSFDEMGASYELIEQTNRGLMREIQEKEERVSHLSSQCEEKTEAIESLREEIERQKREAEESANSLDGMQSSLEEKINKIQGLKESNAELTRGLKAEREKYNGLASTYQRDIATMQQNSDQMCKRLKEELEGERSKYQKIKVDEYEADRKDMMEQLERLRRSNEDLRRENEKTKIEKECNDSALLSAQNQIRVKAQTIETERTKTRQLQKSLEGKIAELKSYDEYIKTMQSEGQHRERYLSEQIEALLADNERYRQREEMYLTPEQAAKYEEERLRLLIRDKVNSEHLQKVSEENARLGSHNNSKQKINMYHRVREENNKLVQDKAQLQLALHKEQQTVKKLRAKLEATLPAGTSLDETISAPLSTVKSMQAEKENQSKVMSSSDVSATPMRRKRLPLQIQLLFVHILNKRGGASALALKITPFSNGQAKPESIKSLASTCTPSELPSFVDLPMGKGLPIYQDPIQFTCYV